jgi:hypothetical protein
MKDFLNSELKPDDVVAFKLRSGKLQKGYVVGPKQNMITVRFWNDTQWDLFDSHKCYIVKLDKI